MKRLPLLLALVVAACSTPASQLPGDLTSPQGLVVANDELFIANTNSDELRVLELNVDPTKRIFASAPNPIYVLSIPVVPRPIALASDVDPSSGQSTYVFAISAVSSRLGIVDAASKTELAEVALPGAPLSLTVQKAADKITVFIGISAGEGRGAIVEVPVDPTPANVAATPPTPTVAFDLGAAAPAGLALSPDGKQLLIGDLLANGTNPDGGAARGGVIVLDLESKSSTRVDVGGAAGRVLFNPAAIQEDGGPDIPAGTYAYVIVESTGCQSGVSCGGVQVLTHGGDGGYSVPVVGGQPAAPIRVPGVATDLAIATRLPGDTIGPLSLANATTSTILIAAPSTNGFVYFIDGLAGRTYDVTTDAGGASAVLHVDPTGAATADTGLLGPHDPDGGSGPPLVPLGGLEAQDVVVEYQGALPVLAARQAVVVGGAISDPGLDFTALGVQAGDLVEFSGAPSGCPSAATVASAPTGVGALALSPAIADSCFPAGGTATYTVRVGTTATPYLVAGTVSGYLGRVGPNARFASTVAYFWASSDAQAGTPALTFLMGAGDPQRGASFRFSVDPGVAPISAGGGPNAILPGPAAWSNGLRKFYVGYPGSALGSQLTEIDPALVQAGTSNGSAEFQ